jgi:hypothetical protein
MEERRAEMVCVRAVGEMGQRVEVGGRSVRSMRRRRRIFVACSPYVVDMECQPRRGRCVGDQGMLLLGV